MICFLKPLFYHVSRIFTSKINLMQKHGEDEINEIGIIYQKARTQKK